MNRTTTLILIALCMLAFQAEARMYQWTNPVSGKTQLSGKPPAWYRSTSAQGPRVFVFENGKLMDDTSRPVQEQQRAELRSVAFGVEQSEEVPELLFDEEDTFATQLRLSLRDADAPSSGDGEAADQAQAEGADSPDSGDSDEVIQQSIDRLKSIIYDWDNRQTQRAREILEASSEQQEK